MTSIDHALYRYGRPVSIIQYIVYITLIITIAVPVRHVILYAYLQRRGLRDGSRSHGNDKRFVFTTFALLFAARPFTVPIVRLVNKRRLSRDHVASYCRAKTLKAK